MSMSELDDVRSGLAAILAGPPPLSDSVYWELLHAQQQLTPVGAELIDGRSQHDTTDLMRTLTTMLGRIEAAIADEDEGIELVALGHAARHLRRALSELAGDASPSQAAGPQDPS
jgi:hypothetical protein